MQTIKNLFKNKWIRWTVIAAVIGFIAWYVLATAKRNKARAALVQYLTGLPETDQWKKQITDKAKAAGRTTEEQIALDAAYMYPANIFKPANR